ncbi:Maf family protein [Bacillus sp. FJAT-45037]|uniref:Maf family protein n=1 Tax=Bacillus sp. FJAT-45037 TaxID=2011007 RepID=UPI000C23C3CD|nr:Maf family protein [Bacillus sp. FJAT-45037]
MNSFILASGSPRRKELLQQAHYTFQIETSDVDETFESHLTPSEVVCELARKKAEAVAVHHPNAVVLGADTVVVCDDNILGKPKDEAEALEMLRVLNDRDHSVLTGVAICHNGKTKTFFEETVVHFYPLTEEDMSRYVQTREPFDKAGGYGIQGFGAYLVHSISGDYNTVVGLPLAKTMRELTAFGIYPTLV